MTTPRSTLFPYTALFRSAGRGRPRQRVRHHRQRGVPPGPQGPHPGLQRHHGFRRGEIRGAVEVLDVVLVVLAVRSEEHTSELQSRRELVCRLLLGKKKSL